jgi:hypothetical protein
MKCFPKMMNINKTHYLIFLRYFKHSNATTYLIKAKKILSLQLELKMREVSNRLTSNKVFLEKIQLM